MSYIVPSKIPENCDECMMRYVDEFGYFRCKITNQLAKSGGVGRFDNCPLTEIPTPHGKLIDKTKLKRELFVNFMGERIPFYDCDNFPTTLTYINLNSILSEQPTLIEAEE